MIKLAVVVFVIAVGWAYVQPANWTRSPTWQRVLPEEQEIPGIVKDHFKASHAAAFPQGTGAIDRELNCPIPRSRWAGKESQRLLKRPARSRRKRPRG